MYIIDIDLLTTYLIKHIVCLYVRLILVHDDRRMLSGACLYVHTFACECVYI